MTSSPLSSGMSLNAQASEPNSWLRCASVSRLCEPILNQVRFYTVESDAPWCRGFRISSSRSQGRNVSPYSPSFIMRAIPQSGPVARAVPANHRIDADRFAAGDAVR